MLLPAMSSTPPFTVRALYVPRAWPLAICRYPPLTIVPPVYVLLPASSTLPPPETVSATGPAAPRRITRLDDKIPPRNRQCAVLDTPA